MADRKIVDDVHHITKKRGNGQLRREIWMDDQGQVTRYNLAYINHALHSGDTDAWWVTTTSMVFITGTTLVLSLQLNSRVLTTWKTNSLAIGMHSGAPHEKSHP